jgi:hypothetical protein
MSGILVSNSQGISQLALNESTPSIRNPFFFFVSDQIIP